VVVLYKGNFFSTGNSPMVMASSSCNPLVRMVLPCVQTAPAPSPCEACQPQLQPSPSLCTFLLRTRQFDWRFPMHGEIANGDGESITDSKLASSTGGLLCACMRFMCKIDPCWNYLQNNPISGNCL